MGARGAAGGDTVSPAARSSTGRPVLVALAVGTVLVAPTVLALAANQDTGGDAPAATAPATDGAEGAGGAAPDPDDEVTCDDYTAAPLPPSLQAVDADAVQVLARTCDQRATFDRATIAADIEQALRADASAPVPVELVQRVSPFGAALALQDAGLTTAARAELRRVLAEDGVPVADVPEALQPLLARGWTWWDNLRAAWWPTLLDLAEAAATLVVGLGVAWLVLGRGLPAVWSRVRRRGVPRLRIATITGGEDGLAAQVTAQVRERMLALGQESGGGSLHFVDEATQPVEVPDLSALSDPLRLASPLVSALWRLGKRESYVLTGAVLDGAGGRTGLSLSLQQGAQVVESITLWPSEFEPPTSRDDADTAVRDLLTLVTPAATWTLFRCLARSGRADQLDPFGTREWRSLALLRAGLRTGGPAQRALFVRAWRADRDSLAPRINIAAYDSRSIPTSDLARVPAVVEENRAQLRAIEEDIRASATHRYAHVQDVLRDTSPVADDHLYRYDPIWYRVAYSLASWATHGYFAQLHQLEEREDDPAAARRRARTELAPELEEALGWSRGLAAAILQTRAELDAHEATGRELDDELVGLRRLVSGGEVIALVLVAMLHCQQEDAPRLPDTSPADALGVDPRRGLAARLWAGGRLPGHELVEVVGKASRQRPLVRYAYACYYAELSSLLLDPAAAATALDLSLQHLWTALEAGVSLGWVREDPNLTGLRRSPAHAVDYHRLVDRASPPPRVGRPEPAA